MLLPEGEGTRPCDDGDGVPGVFLGLFLLPNILVSLLPVLPLACLLKLSTCKPDSVYRPYGHAHTVEASCL